jgi:hypothetical protein
MHRGHCRVALLYGMVDCPHGPIAMAVAVVKRLFEMLPGVPKIIDGITVLRVLGWGGFGHSRTNHGNCHSEEKRQQSNPDSNCPFHLSSLVIYSSKVSEPEGDDRRASSLHYSIAGIACHVLADSIAARHSPNQMQILRFAQNDMSSWAQNDLSS